MQSEIRPIAVQHPTQDSISQSTSAVFDKVLLDLTSKESLSSHYCVPGLLLFYFLKPRSNCTSLVHMPKAESATGPKAGGLSVPDSRLELHVHTLVCACAFTYAQVSVCICTCVYMRRSEDGPWGWSSGASTSHLAISGLQVFTITPKVECEPWGSELRSSQLGGKCFLPDEPQPSLKFSFCY